MGRLHQNYNIYLGDDLTWTKALIAEDQHRHVVVIKTRRDQGGWGEVYRLTDTGPMLRNGPAGIRWIGQHEGQEVTLTALRVDGGCVPCSRR